VLCLRCLSYFLSAGKMHSNHNRKDSGGDTVMGLALPPEEASAAQFALAVPVPAQPPAGPEPAPAQSAAPTLAPSIKFENGTFHCPDAKCGTTVKKFQGMQRHIVDHHEDFRDKYVPFYCIKHDPVATFTDAEGLRLHNCKRATKRGYETKKSEQQEKRQRAEKEVKNKPDSDFKSGFALDDCCKTTQCVTLYGFNRHRAEVHYDGASCIVLPPFQSKLNCRPVLRQVSVHFLRLRLRPSISARPALRKGAQFWRRKEAARANCVADRRLAIMVGGFCNYRAGYTRARVATCGRRQGSQMLFVCL
jgi:hypothetical protein